MPILSVMDQGATTLQGRIRSAGRLDRALAEACTGTLPGGGDLSRERVKALIAEGRVTLDGKPVSSGAAKAVEGTPFTISMPETVPLEAVAQDIPLTIVYEDDHLIVVDKPAGLVVHPAAGNLDGTLVNALLHHCAGRLSGIGGVARPGIVHRIDKDTSGLLVVAKSDTAHEGLAGSSPITRSSGPISASPMAAPCRLRAPCAGPSPAIPPTASAWRCCPMATKPGAASMPSPTSACAKVWTAPPSSSAAWRPGAPIRCAFTWRPLAIR
jgi:hypothetical protein